MRRVVLLGCVALALVFALQAQAVVIVDVTFDDLSDGTVTDGTTILNGGTGGNGLWDGGDTPISGGVVDTTSTDGYVNFASGVGLVIDLDSSLTYNFKAVVDPELDATRDGLFGQLQAWTDGPTGWWMRLNGASDTRLNLRRQDGSEGSMTWDTTSVLNAPGFHTIEFSIDAPTDTASLFIDGSQFGGTWDLATDGFTGVIGEPDKRVVLNAYNATASNRFDGQADSYSITVIPEPGSMALLLAGIMGISMFRRTRR